MTKNCIFAIVNIYQNILSAREQGKKLLAVLIDPEKMNVENIPAFFKKVHRSIATHILVGGSTDKDNQTENVVTAIKKATNLPVILFPGDVSQISHKADGILFLSLISGRNPEYLIEQQIKAAPILKDSNLEILSTGYILIDGKKETATQKVSNTKPIAQENLELILNTALAGQFAGKKLIYLEAGSGARVPVEENIISLVRKNLAIPLIVGGGIRSKEQLEIAFNAGADIVVIGTAFENDATFFEELKK
ncbi:geranylgeranylglyceryl/heptaprenylglyceryl phosphate synthase [Polaribacter sp. IC073]|uniref:geranylgeranylglyceryl/heptaprenylglyceryl phosphate synthase n=1 Tax=Polaribacter sp. IC073 TaxID=2508540 RepID=UPI0011BFD7CA|nr:geranylgeranylglyceryl/heptaprenylglyceryl phosphate synthase [Polaribacter sp. IC073]TXD46824.1 geranylgeranylglyceryl/heptaprenylglyceryl phosphate synthase [Polaribacter sp. IC073]